MNLKTILISLTCVAVLLGFITFYVVFMSGGGTYVISSLTGPNATIFATGTAPAGFPSSTASSSFPIPPLSAGAASSSASSTVAGGTEVSWTQGGEAMTVTGATISGTQLTLDVEVAMGKTSECVPLTLRMIADEQGNLAPPITQQFTFPDTGSCNGTPGETYSAQQVVFDISANPAAFPFVFTTGGNANTLFEVVENPGGGYDVQLPPNSG